MLKINLVAKVLLALLAFFLNSNASAMMLAILPPDNDQYTAQKTNQIEEPKQPANSQSENKKKGTTAKRLHNACKNYWDALEKGLGCWICNVAQNLAETDKAKHIKSRKEQVRTLTESLISLDYGLMNFKDAVDGLGDPEGSAGTLFVELCSELLGKNVNEKLNNQDSHRCSCLCCWEKKKEIVCLPCCHLTYDDNCYTNELGKPNTCPVCRGDVVSIRKIDLKMCMGCFGKPGEMLSVNCSHVAICNECLGIEKPTRCKYCSKKTKFQQLYY